MAAVADARQRSLAESREAVRVARSAMERIQAEADSLRSGLQAAESELGQLRTAGSRVFDLVLGALSSGASLVTRLGEVPGRLAEQSEAIANNGVYAGANLALAVSHYDGIDLTAVDEGFAAGRPDEELDAIESMAAPTASQLAAMVPAALVLHMAQKPEDAE